MQEFLGGIFPNCLVIGKTSIVTGSDRGKQLFLRVFNVLTINAGHKKILENIKEVEIYVQKFKIAHST